MKTILISIGALIIIGLFVFAYQITGSTNSTVTQTPANVPPPTQSVGLPTANSVVNTTTKSTPTPQPIAPVKTMQTNDVLKDPATVQDPINPGYYYLGYHAYEGVPDATATNTPPYIIEYISATHYFNIELLQEPIGLQRREAEQYLMAHLGISQAQMCQLNYMLSVPNSVNSQYAGENLGFSFCPGATVLPN
jgi:hypothetical protein